MIRAFIAVDLSPEIKQRLEQVSRELQKALAGSPIRWAAVASIHLTLKFMGDISPANVSSIQKILEMEGSKFSPFDLRIGTLGAFPSLARPRVLWIGVEAPPELAKLQHSVDVETARLGYPAEERPFSPHLTLGRMNRNAGPHEVARVGEALRAEMAPFLGVSQVDAVRLYRSELNPSGSIYTPLFTAALQGHRK